MKLTNIGEANSLLEDRTELAAVAAVLDGADEIGILVLNTARTQEEYIGVPLDSEDGRALLAIARRALGRERGAVEQQLQALGGQT